MVVLALYVLTFNVANLILQRLKQARKTAKDLQNQGVVELDTSITQEERVDLQYV